MVKTKFSIHKTYDTVITVAIIIILIIVGIFLVREFNRVIDNRTNIINNQNIILADTIEYYIDNDSNRVAKIRVLETTSVKQLNEITTNNKSIKELQKLVSSYKGINKKLTSAIIFKNTIIASYTDSIQNLITGSQVVSNDSNSYVYPTYSREIDMFNGWITGNIELGYSITNFSINTNSRYDITMGQERHGIFSKYQTYAIIVNHNPYETTKDAKVYSKLKTDRRWGLVTSIGYGVSNGGFGTCISIGIGYTLMYLW